MPGFEPGSQAFLREVPKLEGYQTIPHPLGYPKNEIFINLIIS